MELNSKYHGIVQYNAEEVLNFSKGIPGFEALREFIVFKVEENEIFSVLHSIENEEVGFVVTSPFNVFKDYEFSLSDETIENLNISDEKEVLVLNTVTLNSDVNKITVNLKAPIVININKRLGEQIILDNNKYNIRYPLLESY